MLKQITYTVELFEMAGKYKNISVYRPDDIPTDLLVDMFGNCLRSHEEMHAIYLDNNLTMRFTERVGQGSINACLVPIERLITTMAIQRSKRLILIHNHPSGNQNFSTADKGLFTKIENTCKALDFELLDFLLVDTEFKLHTIKGTS